MSNAAYPIISIVKKASVFFFNSLSVSLHGFLCWYTATSNLYVETAENLMTNSAIGPKWWAIIIINVIKFSSVSCFFIRSPLWSVNTVNVISFCWHYYHHPAYFSSFGCFLHTSPFYPSKGTDFFPAHFPQSHTHPNKSMSGVYFDAVAWSLSGSFP